MHKKNKIFYSKKEKKNRRRPYRSPFRNLCFRAFVNCLYPSNVSIRQRTSAYVSVRQQNPCVSSLFGLPVPIIRQHTSAYVSVRQHTLLFGEVPVFPSFCELPGPIIHQHTSAYVVTSAYAAVLWGGKSPCLQSLCLRAFVNGLYPNQQNSAANLKGYHLTLKQYLN